MASGRRPFESLGSDTKIASTIHKLAYEQELVQKKTFTNWINSILTKRNPPQKITELFEDIKDGTKLLGLLETVSGEKLRFEKGKNLRRLHFLSNVRTALEFLEKKKIKLVNINATDVVDGKPAIVLGLVWVIILYYQIEEQTNILAKQVMGLSANASTTDGPSPAKKKATDKQGAKKALLNWAQRAATKSVKVEVRDFGKSWRDGYAFNAMIHSINPDLIDMEVLPQKTNEERLDNAFLVAEKDLGIPKLLDPKDVDVDKPDERSIMTYVAQFLQQYPEVGDDENSSLMGSVRDMHAVAQEEEHFYQDVIDHLTHATAVLGLAREGKMTKLEEYEKQEELAGQHERKKKKVPTATLR